MELSDNVNAMIKGQAIPVYRIDLRHMENSRIDWQIYATKKEVLLKSTKESRPHQEEAIKKVCEGLKEADRGKLIMACGTGKTFTSLKIAETIAGKGKRVLFLVPSLALVSQTIREWYNGKSIEHLHLYAYEVTSRHHHYICQLVGVATALALRRFIRAIFNPFLYKFDPHTHPTCYVQIVVLIDST